MELKPCPFCGGEARTHYHSLEQTWSVECGQCSCMMPYVGLTEADAIAAWNHRPAEQALRIEGARMMLEKLQAVAEVEVYSDEGVQWMLDRLVSLIRTARPAEVVKEASRDQLDT